MKKILLDKWLLIPAIISVVFGIIILALALTNNYIPCLIFIGMEIMSVLYVCFYGIFKIPKSSASHSKSEENKQGD